MKGAMSLILIGIDLGGTNVRMGVVTPNGEVQKRVQYPLERRKGAYGMMEELASKLEVLLSEVSVGACVEVRIGLGVPGPVDLKRGILIEPPNLPELHQFPLRDFFEKRLPFCLVLENDANAFALGEGWLGAAKGCQNYCGITLGTGVGGGVVIEGKILRGQDGYGGEVGHMVLDPEGPACGCGGKGCLEVFASATGIRRMALEAFERRGLQGERIQNPSELTSEDVFKAAEEGEEWAGEVFKAMGRYLGLGLVNLTNLFNPQRIVIGGKVAAAWDHFFPTARKVLQERAMRGQRERVEVVRAQCGDDAGMIGAAYVALNFSNPI
ncbi:MAG: ROK family protein [Desulfobacterota bacterium]|nr:ROK family protein [Thermodesulfobacteriota bacterium]